MFELLLNRAIYDEVIRKRVPDATSHVWIVTADIKDMYVHGGRRYVPFLQVLAALVERGVAVRVIHAKEPGPRFRSDFARFEALADGELFELIMCPRVHTKAIVIDGRTAFVGSANLTGAGMGSKNDDRRNFEAGFLFDEAEPLERLIRWIDSLYVGNYCQACQRKEYCPSPIMDLQGP